MVSSPSLPDESEEVVEGGEGDNEGAVTYHITSEVHYSSSKFVR